MARARRTPEARRADLVGAARVLFLERGVDATSIEDITRAAGVAHGTFYLYFKTKDDAVNAAVAQMAGELVERVSAAGDADAPAGEKLTAIREALVGLSGLAVGADDLIAHYHGPEHREVHDRLSHEVNRQLVPVIAAIIEQGVAEGVFDVGNPRAAAAFVLAAAEGLDLLATSGTLDAGTADALMSFVMRGLGRCDS